MSVLALTKQYFRFVYSPTTGKRLASSLFSTHINIDSSSSSSTKQQQPSSEEMENNDSWKSATNVYEFSAKDIDGNVVNMDKYKGRVVMVLNVACLCGFTAGNYPQLQQLHDKYNSEGLSILAFPCNQFGGQEPNSEQEIKEFVKQYNVQFDMFSKVNVNGDSAHPLFKYLKSKLGGTLGSFIKWNFTKFLVDRNGVPVKRYAPTTNPKDIEQDIINLLKQNS